MTGIQLVNTLTNEQWAAVCHDSRFDVNYGEAIASHPESLANELTTRIEKICNQMNIVPPTKVVVTYDVRSELQLESGELRIHPLTFAACKLSSSQMSAEHQELYKKFKNCITNTGVIVSQSKQPIDTKKQQTRVDNRNLLLRQELKLNEIFKKYQHIVPSDELDHRIMVLMGIEGEIKPSFSRSAVENLIKISYVSTSILTGIAIGLVANKFTPENLYWPVAGTLALLTAKLSWESLKQGETAIPLLTQAAFKSYFGKNHELLNESWNSLSSEAKLFSAKYETVKSRTEKFLTTLVVGWAVGNKS
jgi:hypothetical protein